MQIHLHQTHHLIADFDAIYKYLENQFIEQYPASGIHLFPELFLGGYPLQDLCLQKSFMDSYEAFIESIQLLVLEKMKLNDSILILMGGLKYSRDDNGLPQKIENVILIVLDNLIKESLFFINS